jgi:hypothetical protein
MGLSEPIGGDAVRAIDGVTGLADPGNGAGKALTRVHRFCIVQSKRIENFDTDVDGPRLPATAYGAPRCSRDLSAPAPRADRAQPRSFKSTWRAIWRQTDGKTRWAKGSRRMSSANFATTSNAEFLAMDSHVRCARAVDRTC